MCARIIQTTEVQLLKGIYEIEAHPDDVAPRLVVTDDVAVAETRFSDGNVVGGCSFRDAFAHRRCVFPVNGWYEWQQRGGAKIPHLIDREDGGTVHLAGIWETWTSGDGSDGFAVLTTEPRLEIAAVHDRQPAVLDIEQVQEWLCPGTGRNRLRELAGQLSTERFRIRRVSRAVNNRRNDSPDLLATAG